MYSFPKYDYIILTVHVIPLRPLPEEMLKYAQADTHYLLYVYDRLRADLFDAANGQSNLIQVVWSKSKDLCLKVQLYLAMYNRIINGKKKALVGKLPLKKTHRAHIMEI